MADPEVTYKSLISVDNLEDLPTEEALSHIGRLTDTSLDMEKIEGLKLAIKLLEELQKRYLTTGQLATSHYFLANAWASLRTLLRVGSDKSWEWEQKEIEKEIVHLRRALPKDAVHELPDERVCQILTNLGNLMDHIGRFVEAVEYWNRALAILPTFPMARGNRGFGFTHYARALYDRGHVDVFLKYAHTDLSIATLSELHTDARKSFDKYLTEIEAVLPPEFFDKDFDMHGFFLGASEQEILYRKWCLENRLFLNPLNDIGPHSIAANDILTTPSIIVRIGEGPYYQGYFNQMKQELVSARYLYYDGMNEERPHFSDRGVLLYNTLDYPSYSLSVEKEKAAFRIVYSLFDKIAFFLNEYLDLSIPKKKVTFKTLWYKAHNKKKGLRKDFQHRQNWPLRGLFWLSKDLFEDNLGFKESIEPDAQELNDIRNHLEHKYLKLHEAFWHGPPSDSNEASLAFSDTLAFSMHRGEFKVKTLRLIKMARAALIYLSLAIHCEEQRRTIERGHDSIVPRMPLDVWEDEWKV